ncbi:hypothetical protein [Rathayibacter sp. VKM Ac-2801]|uniref:hypothetical protein n=1 Tax=Rathayibacter sp. VKM Ac-2801 TaxID=2609255 RepID=UPI00132037F7|nr:hypothetical protein [Rathayibacter sp. VKM Ac-2801]QHC71783.1 hypothetical protein GSU45_16240 [Rathayibacter sp. VKM Ac-2801]
MAPGFFGGPHWPSSPGRSAEWLAFHGSREDQWWFAAVSEDLSDEAFAHLASLGDLGIAGSLLSNHSTPMAALLTIARTHPELQEMVRLHGNAPFELMLEAPLGHLTQTALNRFLQHVRVGEEERLALFAAKDAEAGVGGESLQSVWNRMRSHS